MDLMNLPTSLKNGIRIPQDDARTVIVTPLGRFDFPYLAKPRQGKPRADGTVSPSKYGVRMIWNYGDSAEPAHVNIQTVLLPAIGEVARRVGMNPKGHLRRGDEEKLQRQDGSWPPGLGPGTVFASLNTFATTKDGAERPAPKVLDFNKVELDRSLLKAGYYGRAVMAIYTATHEGVTKVCYGLEEIQLLAKGELLGGSVQRDYGSVYDNVSGDSFAQEPPSQFDDYPVTSANEGTNAPSDDDIPF